MVAPLVGLLMTAVVACGNVEERSLCRAYDDFLAAREEIRTVDPTSVTAAEATDLVEEYVSSVRALRETTEGRFDTELDRLEAATRDILVTLESVDADEDYATWAPLVEESFDDARDAADRVVEIVDIQCNPETED